MLEPIPGLPPNALGFRAKGKVTAKDYQNVLIPAVEKMFAEHKSLRFLYELGEGFAGFEGAALWDDAKLGLRHLSRWERMAVVSDVEWIRVALKVFGLAMPGHVRVFHDTDLADAVRWICE